MSTLIDIMEASILLNLTPQQVRNLCRNKKLSSKKHAGVWLLYKEEVLEYFDKSSCGFVRNQHNYTNIKHRKNNKPIALSFFSGAMGLDIGLEQAGFEVVLCSEIDNACRKTILKNKPDIALLGDINNYSVNDILKASGLKHDSDIDLIIGGPPCQSFSTAGKRKAFNDERGNVFLTFINIAVELKPKFIVIENVRGLLSAPLNHRPHKDRDDKNPKLSSEEQKGGALYHILNKLENTGYGVSFNLYNSANYGSPQKRERVVIICSRNGEKLPYLIPTNSENGDFNLPKWNTFRDAVKGLEKISHHYINFPEKRLKYYRLLKPGQNWRNLPPKVQKNALGISYYSSGGKTGFLRRLAWDEPSPTLVTHPAMPATDLAHPLEDRPLSVEEYKRLQEFPDNWKIEGSLIEQYKQIGNAVPISLGKAIGHLLFSYMNGIKLNIYHNFPYSRYKNTDEISWLNNYMLSNK